jgi:hypothetical protein
MPLPLKRRPRIYKRRTNASTEQRQKTTASPLLSPPNSSLNRPSNEISNFPPFPNLPISSLSYFVNGAMIAIENIKEDSAADPDIPFSQLLAKMESETPTIERNRADRRTTTLQGRDWVIGAVFEELNPTRSIDIDKLCKDLLEWVDALVWWLQMGRSHYKKGLNARKC